MYTRQKCCSFVCFLFILVLFSKLQAQSTKILAEHVPNLYKVSDQLYRSAQPKKQSLMELGTMGVKTILNLRNVKGNRGYKGDSDIELKRYRIHSWRMDYEAVLATFQLFLSADKPLLVHCKHGADRTGVFVAVYRILFDNWTKQDAIEELRNGGFGFHERYFSYMVKLIEDLDVNRLKSDLNL